MTAKLWNERDFDECCYAVSGKGAKTMVCATPCRGSYCETHLAELQADFAEAPRINAQIQASRREARLEKKRATSRLGRVSDALRDAVISEAAQRYGCTPAAILSKRQQPNLIDARHESMWRLRGIENEDGQPVYSLLAVAQAVGCSDHTSALHAVRRIEGLVAEQVEQMAAAQ